MSSDAYISYALNTTSGPYPEDITVGTVNLSTLVTDTGVLVTDATTVTTDATPVTAAVAALVADGATPTQAHVNTLNAAYATLATAITALKRPASKPSASLGLPAALDLSPPSVATTNYQSGGVNANTIGTVNQTILRANRAKYLVALQAMYAAGGQILGVVENSPATDENVASELSAANDWLNTSHIWILQNMTPAAAQSLITVEGLSLIYTVSPDIKQTEDTRRIYNALRNNLPQYMRNIQYLMENDTMDPQNGTAP